VAGIEDEEGWFPQVSGLSFKYSPSGTKGARIREILIAGQPLDPGKEYVVATNDFLAVGRGRIQSIRRRGEIFGNLFDGGGHDSGRESRVR